MQSTAQITPSTTPIGRKRMRPRKEMGRMVAPTSLLLAAMLALLGHAAATNAAVSPRDNNSPPNLSQGVSLRGSHDKEHYSFQIPAHHDFHCFSSNQELRAAVVRYKGHTHFDEELASRYGWPIGNWCTSQVTDFAGIFQHQRHFNEPLAGWSTVSATNMAYMFQDAQRFDQDLGHFDVSKVQNMNNMFEAAIRFTGRGLAKWKTLSVATMEFMFMHALQFNANISPWNVHQTTNMKGLFKDARAFSHDVKIMSEWDFHPQVDLSQMSDWWSENAHSQTTSLLRSRRVT